MSENKKPCPRCLGDGSVTYEAEWHKDGYAFKPCPVCNGTGTVCATCGGSGILGKPNKINAALITWPCPDCEVRNEKDNG